jgi:hypothetical protein
MADERIPKCNLKYKPERRRHKDLGKYGMIMSSRNRRDVPY